MNWEKLDQKKKGLVVGAAICFVAALVFFVMGLHLVLLVSFTLAAVLPLLAIDGGATSVASDEYSQADDEMIAALQERLNRAEEQLKVRNQTSDSKDKEMDALNKTILARDEEIASLKKKLEEAASAAAAVFVAEESSASDDVMSTILPKGEGDEAKKQTLDITGEIRAAAKDFEKSAQEAGVEIRVVDPEVPMYVSASPIMMRTMFRDIMDNAIKYMRRSGSLQVTVANLEDDIFIAMKDNGQGLSESETGHIFELNYQGSNRISGNGLGLAQVKAIVDYYGGMIYAKSSPGRGMGIYVHLPAERV